MQMVRQAEKSGITLRSQNQWTLTLKPQAANVWAQHGKAQQGGPAAAAKLGHKGGARVCRSSPELFRPAIDRPVFIRSAFAWPTLLWRQMKRSKSGQQKGVRAKAQAAFRLFKAARKMRSRLDNMLRQGFLHGQSYFCKPGSTRSLTTRGLAGCGNVCIRRRSVHGKHKDERCGRL